MGRIAELFEKKALGTITDEEKAELEQLTKEAELAKADDGANGGDGGSSNDDGGSDEDVEEVSTKLADAITNKIDSALDNRFKDLKDHLKENDETVIVKDNGALIFDKSLGKKATVKELEDTKIKVAGRENKTFKEVTLKTVHFINALISNDVEKLQVLVEGTGARGGFLVPDEFANMIVEDIRDLNVMRQLANVMQISGDTLRLPSLASRPKANWRSEAAVKATSTVDFGETVFTPYSLAVIVGLSNELVADASLGVNGSLVNYVSNIMATSLAEKEEEAYWNGDGSGKPTGVDNYTLRTITAAGVSDEQRASAIMSAYQRTPQGYRQRGTWVANSGTWENIGELKDSNGNFLLTGLQNAPTQTLRGRPIAEVNSLPGGKLFYGDFGYYTIVDREGIEVRVSDEATVASQSAFERNLTFVRVEKRTDGELVLPAAITEVQGLGTP